MTALAPCPFCGGTDISPDTTWGEIVVDGVSRDAVAARCLTCDAQGPMVLKGTDVVEAWNRRRALRRVGWLGGVPVYLGEPIDPDKEEAARQVAYLRGTMSAEDVARERVAVRAWPREAREPLTAAELEAVRYALESHHDCGPPGEGWQSDDLERGAAKLIAALEARDRVYAAYARGLGEIVLPDPGGHGDDGGDE